MAPPFLAVTLDAKRRIARTADAIGGNVAAFTLGYLNLLELVWERKDPKVSALALSACFGPDPRVPAALVEFAFLVVVGEGVWELTKEEADRLLLTHKQRVAAGKARSASAGRSAGRMLKHDTSGPPAENQRAASGEPALTPSTQHPAPSTQEDLPRAPPAPTLDLQALWNGRAERHGLPRWDAMAGKRKAACLARLREHPDAAWWEKVLAGVYASPFLCGDPGPWRANPDWLLRPGSAESVLEGKYAGRAVSGRQGGRPDDIRKGTVRAEDQDHLHGPAGPHEF